MPADACRENREGKFSDEINRAIERFNDSRITELPSPILFSFLSRLRHRGSQMGAAALKTTTLRERQLKISRLLIVYRF